MAFLPVSGITAISHMPILCNTGVGYFEIRYNLLYIASACSFVFLSTAGVLLSVWTPTHVCLDLYILQLH
jgi:hypothetical protein